MDKKTTIYQWIPLINKLVWPVLLILGFLIFHSQVAEVYSTILAGIKSGRSVEIGGILKLGEAASQTEIAKLSSMPLTIEGLGGEGGVTRKGSAEHLYKLKEELRQNPTRQLNTLLITDNIRYSPELLRKYVSTLGLRYVVYLHSGKFDGWVLAKKFVAQLPKEETPLTYSFLREETIGVTTISVLPQMSAKDVLSKMQKLHQESIPVVDKNGQWLFFASREEIISDLLIRLLLESQ